MSRTFSTTVDGVVDGQKVQEAFRQVDDAEVLWKACAEVLREQVSEAVWLTSFNDVKVKSLRNGLLILAVPSSVVRERIEARYLAVVKGALADAGGAEIDLEFQVHTDEDTFLAVGGTSWTNNGGRLIGSENDDSGLSAASDPGPERSSTDAGNRAPKRADDIGAITPNRRYTFESFITGTSNRFAHAAALAVAETPAKSYNPLFIYGAAGLGKTHLLQAISAYVGEHYPNFVVRYVSTEHFLNQYVEAIRTGEMADFKRRYREVDVLLLDDIQFIEGKEGLQEELFHTFNALYQSNHQIVLSSDRPPDAISTLEDRLRSRFRMGLITEINPPDLETRLAILRTKAEGEQTPMPADVLEYIASGITNNIRELEGALIRVSAYASLTHETLSLELAQRVLKDLLSGSEPRPITPALILEKTAEMFNFPIDEIQGKSRRRPLVTARQISMFCFRELTDLSYPAIAREFGGRDHTTVIHAVEKIGGLMKERRQIYDQVTELTNSIRNG